MDIKEIDTQEKKGNDGCGVIGIGCLICYGVAIAVILIGGIVTWVVEDSRPALHSAWEWISYNKIRRFSFVLSGLVSFFAFVGGLEMFDDQWEGFARRIVGLLKALAFAVSFSVVFFFVLYGVLEIGGRILEWIDKG